MIILAVTLHKSGSRYFLLPYDRGTHGGDISLQDVWFLIFVLDVAYNINYQPYYCVGEDLKREVWSHGNNR